MFQMTAPEHLHVVKSSTDMVPEVTVFPKPLIPPRPAFFRPSNPRALSFVSPALDLAELKKTQKRVRFLLEKETCKSPVSFARLARPTYHGKCFLCRNNIGDPHTHYNHPVSKTTDSSNKASSDLNVERRNSIVIPSEWKKLEERKRLQGFWESKNYETEEERYFIPIFPNYKTSNRKNKFRNISLSQNQTSKNKHGGVVGRNNLHESGDSDFDKAGMSSNREIGKEHEHDAPSDNHIQNGNYKDHRGTRSDEGTNRKYTHQHDKTYLVRETERRASLGKWCECRSAELADSECWECGLDSGHERWCRFKTGECPDCGKPIKGKHRVSFRPRHFRTLSSSSSDTDAKYEEKKRSKKAKKYKNELPNDPNVHRQAYLLALADSRIQRWRTDPMSFTSPRTGGYFSYFSSLCGPKYKSASGVKDVPWLGVRGQEDKVKVKDPMKHILGSVNLNDYYPNGKKFFKEY